jgi:hypothetical protein
MFMNECFLIYKFWVTYSKNVIEINVLNLMNFVDFFFFVLTIYL